MTAYLATLPMRYRWGYLVLAALAAIAAVVICHAILEAFGQLAGLDLAGYPAEPGTNRYYAMWSWVGCYQLTPWGWRYSCA